MDALLFAFYFIFLGIANLVAICSMPLAGTKGSHSVSSDIYVGREVDSNRYGDGLDWKSYISSSISSL